jgi:hypothetical protein
MEDAYWKPELSATTQLQGLGFIPASPSVCWSTYSQDVPPYACGEETRVSLAHATVSDRTCSLMAAHLTYCRHELLHGGCEVACCEAPLGRAHEEELQPAEEKLVAAAHAHTDIWLLPHRTGQYHAQANSISFVSCLQAIVAHIAWQHAVVQVCAGSHFVANSFSQAIKRPD